MIGTNEVAEIFDFDGAQAGAVTAALAHGVPYVHEAGEEEREYLGPACAFGAIEQLRGSHRGDSAAPRPELAELLALAGELEVRDIELDEHVRDVASRAGSQVNNEGREGQIAYLAERLGADEARRILEQDIALFGRLDAE